MMFDNPLLNSDCSVVYPPPGSHESQRANARGGSDLRVTGGEFGVEIGDASISRALEQGSRYFGKVVRMPSGDVHFHSHDGFSPGRCGIQEVLVSSGFPRIDPADQYGALLARIMIAIAIDNDGMYTGRRDCSWRNNETLRGRIGAYATDYLDGVQSANVGTQTELTEQEYEEAAEAIGVFVTDNDLVSK